MAPSKPERPDRPGTSSTTRSEQFLQYQVIASRRQQYDLMMWQVPALGLTAQAFLMSIALGHQTSQVARALAASLAVVAAGLSMQLMSKHRHHERLDSDRLEKFEADLGLSPEHGRRAGSRNPIARAKSYTVWMIGLAVFALAGVCILVIDCWFSQLL